MPQPSTQPEGDGDDQRAEGDERDDAELAMIKLAVLKLMEHFDTVHIFTTRFVNSDEGTNGLQFGDGNWYARLGMVKTWLAKQDQGSRNEVE